MLALASLCLVLGSASAARILVFPYSHCVNSHLLNMEKLASLLLEGGHQVAMIVPRGYTEAYSGVDLSNIELLYYEPPSNKTMGVCTLNSIGGYLHTPIREVITTFYKATLKYCDAMCGNARLMGVVKRRQFDLAIYDAVDQCSKILADYVDIPFILFYTMGMEGVSLRHPAYMPTLLTSYSDQMTLTQRVLNVIGYVFQSGMKLGLAWYYHQIKVSHNLNTSLNLAESFDRASLKFVLADYGIDYVGPVEPTTIPIGGVIQSSHKPIPPVVSDFLNNAQEEGVVLFSFGTLIKHYEPYWRELFASTLARLPHRVIWKYSGPRPDTLGNNTLLLPWVPQAEILQHKNTRVFITHSGYNSAYESAKNGIPVVAIPIFGDQFFQATKLTHRAQMGVKLDIKTLTSTQLYDAVLKVDGSALYRRQAKQTADIINTKPMSQKAEILYWVDYVIKLQGAAHLRCQVHQLSWCQYFLLDVLFVYCAVFFLVYLFLRCVLSVLRFHCSKVHGSIFERVWVFYHFVYLLLRLKQ